MPQYYFKIPSLQCEIVLKDSGITMRKPTALKEKKSSQERCRQHQACTVRRVHGTGGTTKITLIRLLYS